MNELQRARAISQLPERLRPGGRGMGGLNAAGLVAAGAGAIMLPGAVGKTIGVIRHEQAQAGIEQEVFFRMNESLDEEIASGKPLSQSGRALAQMRANGDLPPVAAM